VSGQTRFPPLTCPRRIMNRALPVSATTLIAESYADTKDGEIWLINANIPEYLQANRFNHEPKSGRASCCCTGSRSTS